MTNSLGILERELPLPADINAEKGVLGAILLERDAISEIAGKLRAQHFYLEKHAWIYEAMLTCYNQQIPCDITTVTDALRKQHAFKEYNRSQATGGITYLIDLTSEVPTAVHVSYYADIVLNTATRRYLIEAGGHISVLAYDERDDVACAVEKARGLLKDVEQQVATRRRTLGKSAKQLMQRPIREIDWLIDGFLSPGLCICAAAAKFGKTWFWLQLAVGLAEGSMALGQLSCKQSDVLYLVLEDGEERLARRLRALGYDHTTIPSSFEYDDTCPRLDEGALSAMQAWVDSKDNPRKVIIVDTYIMIKAVVNSLQSLYDADYKGLTGLRELAQRNDCAVVVIHHTRKQDAQNVFDLINGSMGIQGAVESEMVMYERYGQGIVELKGKDGSHKKLPVRFDGTTMHWILLGDDADEHMASNTRQEIVDAIEQGKMGASEIAETLGKPYNSVVQALKRLRDDNIITSERKGRSTVYGILQDDLLTHDS